MNLPEMTQEHLDTISFPYSISREERREFIRKELEKMFTTHRSKTSLYYTYTRKENRE